LDKNVSEEGGLGGRVIFYLNFLKDLFFLCRAGMDLGLCYELDVFVINFFIGTVIIFFPFLGKSLVFFA
jgi:hypothetical protein